MKTLRIKTQRGNDYLVSRNIPQVLLLHPALNYLLEQAAKGIDLQRHIQNLPDGEISLEENITLPTRELLYYYQQYLLLKENGYFKEMKKYPLTDTRYDAQAVKTKLANTHQIVFEVCDFCNLNCRYFGYGDRRKNGDRPNKIMSPFSHAGADSELSSGMTKVPADYRRPALPAKRYPLPAWPEKNGDKPECH